MLDAPPEVTSTLIYTGPGAGSLTRAALAWQHLAAELQAAQHGVAAVVAGIPWTGPAAVSMRTTVAGYVNQLAALATSAATAGQVATAAAAAFQQAHAAVADPVHVAANRQLVVTLAALNILGQYTAAIALLESAYEQMWAQDTAAMHAYAAASHTAASTLTTPASQVAVAAPADDSSGITSWLDETFQSLLSDAPYDLPTSVLALMTGLWAASSVAAVPDVLNRVRNIIETPAVTAPVPSVRTAVSMSVGAGGRIGGLTVPPNWAQPAAAGARPLTSGMSTFSTKTEAPVALPLPLPNINDRSREQHTSAQPRYGDQPTVMPKHPAGG